MINERSDRHAPTIRRIDAQLFNRAFIYTGSIGEFRYRFDGDKDAGILHTAVYSNVCYELAQDKEERDFTWDEAGVETLKAWLQEKYEAYCTAQK